MTMTDTSDPPANPATGLIHEVADLQDETAQLRRDVETLQAEIDQLKTATIYQQDVLATVQTALLNLPCPEHGTDSTVGTCDPCTCTLGPAVGDVGTAITNPPVPVTPSPVP